jgi:hypothetical protein
MLVMALVFGMALVGCDNGTTSGVDSALNGTWVGANQEITFTNGNFTAKEGGSYFIKGTYTTSGGSITMKVTQVYGGYPPLGGILESKWYSRAELNAFFDNATLNMLFFTETNSYSVSGNKLTIGTDVYTKKS